VEAGAKYLQLEDLGAWLPLFTTNEDDYKWIAEVITQCIDGVKAKIAWHFCFGNAWGNSLNSLFPKGYETVLPYYFHLPIDQFVLDFANREMAGVECLKGLPKDKEVQVGVLDVRTTMIESPEQVVGRIRKVIQSVPPERVYLSTDCGMKPLPRIVAKLKLKALAHGAAIVRNELM
jgi:5-methyltetrahydropteroyltriglutamate--homocysteine methyltransferase